ncbi:polyribonucleotide nucleotidyltransferase [Terriglobus tenax]|uniref:polyribonucleotide nucleotidyltransferase n=1 Tax=Terriglobus tenax TaxID=1111115 RepID=UPI0021E021B4|nr:polyribonucleotide nucleotidyltransferase [Terriglobus tenax]
MKQEVSVELAGGKRITFETGRMAKQASGAALTTSGDTVVLGTAVASAEPKEGIDFFPLTVEYREFTYAGGRIPGGFIKREGRPSEKEILTARQIDRPIRPLFPEAFRNETQVVGFVYSADKENDPDVIAINAASCALALSDIPFNGPVGAVRVGMINGEFVVNPTYAEKAESTMNIMVVGTKDGIVMIESGAKEVAEDKVVDAIEFGHGEIKKIVAVIEELVSKAGKTKRHVNPVEKDEIYYNELKAQVGERLKDALDTQKYAKVDSYAKVKELKDELKAALPADDAAAPKKLSKYYELLREDIFREQVLNDRIRPDRRAFDQVRKIDIEIGVLPRTHGSALFTRGETQALVTTTLGTTDDAQRIETYTGEQKKTFMLHYNFPPFSVGEVGRMSGVGRREIGHGALASRAIEAVLPGEESPYVMRVVSDILESNGSSSMATVCGASLSLMQAGIKLKAAVAGIAMGLVKEGDKYAILTDIAGAEDHYGDMDFKVAGTRNGITALQMDIKIMGITAQIMREALEQARVARIFLLDKMDAVIAGANETPSQFAPRIHTLQIPTDKIRDLIGPGGKVIRGIIDATGVKIDVDDSGRVNVASSDADGLERAIQMISDLTAVPEIGKTYLGKVVRLAEFGAFVEIFPGTDGLLHVSEIAEHRVKDVKDELREGDQVLVKVLGIEGNRIKLSRKAVIREQREKLGLPPVAPQEGGSNDKRDRGPRPPRPERPASSEPTITIEGGDDFEDGDEDLEDDFEGEGEEGEGTDAPAGEATGNGQDQARAGDANRRRRRRRGGRRPGGPGQGGGGNRPA